MRFTATLIAALAAPVWSAAVTPNRNFGTIDSRQFEDNWYAKTVTKAGSSNCGATFNCNTEDISKKLDSIMEADPERTFAAQEVVASCHASLTEWLIAKTEGTTEKTSIGTLKDLLHKMDTEGGIKRCGKISLGFDQGKSIGEAGFFNLDYTIHDPSS